MKAIGLLSGGLDSSVALALVRNEGIDVVALNLVTSFCCCTPKGQSCSAARTAVRQLGIELKVVNVTREFLPVVEDPKHGYGRGMNPCIDCRILMFHTAKRYMEELGAAFVITGEVLGQRPMSQRRAAMDLIERESGLQGLIVRPLSARLLPPTVPEESGWVKREALLSFSGRSRKPQIALAEELDINDYPCPAGGCLLTDKGFAARVRDLLEHDGHLAMHDVSLLKLGRHFRLSSTAKALLGRNEAENERLLALAQDRDAILTVIGSAGPTGLVRGAARPSEIEVACAITARYSRAREASRVDVLCRAGWTREPSRIRVAPAVASELARMRI